MQARNADPSNRTSLNGNKISQWPLFVVLGISDKFGLEGTIPLDGFIIITSSS